MPHYKCAKCKVRLQVPGSSAEPVGDLCPECGSLMEPAVDLAELIGYRTIAARDELADPVLSGSARRIAARVDEFLTRRVARLEREQPSVEVDGWLDDQDDDGLAAALALPSPRTSP